MRIFLSLESDVGDRELNLVTARDLLMKHDVLVMGQSEVRGTELAAQVVECQTELSPQDLLMACKAVEAEMGRPVLLRVGNVQFGMAAEAKPERGQKSCIIDVDILFYGDWIVHESDLKIPHPGMIERTLVVEALCDLAPDFVHPVLKKPLKALLSRA